MSKTDEHLIKELGHLSEGSITLLMLLVFSQISHMMKCYSNFPLL